MSSPNRPIRVTVILLCLCTVLGSWSPRGKIYIGEVEPKDPFLFEGETLALTCQLYNTSHQNTTLYFMYKHGGTGKVYCGNVGPVGRNDRNLSEYTVRANESHIRLEVPNITVNDSGHYVCFQHVGSESHPREIAKQIVTVEYKLQKAGNLTCLVYDWKVNMSCSWQHDLKYLCPQYLKVQLTYIRTSEHDSKPHPCPSLSNNSCFWADHFNDNFTMAINVTSTKREDRYEVSKFIVCSWHHVMPMPVTGLTAKPINSTCVELRWKKNTDRVLRDLKFEIHYKNKTTSANWHEGSPLWSSQVNSTQCNLEPYRNYTFQVRVKPTKGGYFSEPAFVSVQTSEARPTAVPDTCSGCFHQSHGKNTPRSVTVYWRDIPEEEKHGHITYIVQLNDLATLNTTDTWVTFTDVNTSNHDDRIVITPSTQAGKALNNRTIILFNERPDPPKNFVVEDLGTIPKQYLVSWEQTKTDRELNKRITLVWCYRKSVNKRCQTEIKWTDVDTSAHNFTLSPNVTTEGLEISIGSTARDMESKKSSGIEWTDCICQGPPKAPTLQIINSNTVRWEIEKYPNACITGYSITYCQTSDEQTCKGSNVTVNISNNDTMYQLKDIALETNYLVFIEAWSRNKRSQPGKTIFKIYAIPTSLQTDPFNSTLFIILSLCGPLLVGLIISGWWLCYRSKKKFQDISKDTENNASTSKVGMGRNPVQEVNGNKFNYLKVLKKCCGSGMKTHSKNGTSNKRSDSGSPLLGCSDTIYKSKKLSSVPPKGEPRFFPGNKLSASNEEIITALLNKSLEHVHPLLNSSQESNDSYMRISKYVSATEDSGHDIQKCLPDTEDSGQDIQKYVPDTEDSGHHILKYVPDTEDSVHETQNLDMSVESSQRTIKDNIRFFAITTERGFQNTMSSPRVDENLKDTFCTSGASTVSSGSHPEYIRINGLNSSST